MSRSGESSVGDPRSLLRAVLDRAHADLGMVQALCSQAGTDPLAWADSARQHVQQAIDLLKADALAPASAPQDLNDRARAYMHEAMAMSNPFTDQEQNWILGHLVTFAAALGTAPASGWQPIATAPKDGNRVIVWEDGTIWISQWCERQADTLFPNGIHCWASWWKKTKPTHWMPLPSPPEQPLASPEDA